MEKYNASDENSSLNTRKKYSIGSGNGNDSYGCSPYSSEEKKDLTQKLLEGSINSLIYSSKQHETLNKSDESKNEKANEEVRGCSSKENLDYNRYNKEHIIILDNIDSVKNIYKKLLEEEKSEKKKKNEEIEKEQEEEQQEEQQEIEKERGKDIKNEKMNKENITEINEGNMEKKESNINNRNCVNKSGMEMESVKTTLQNGDINSNEPHTMGIEYTDNRSKRKMASSDQNENEKPEKKKKNGSEYELKSDLELSCKLESGILRNMNMRERAIMNNNDIDEEYKEKKEIERGQIYEKNEREQKEQKNEKDTQKEQTEQEVFYAEEVLKNYPRLFAARLPFKATERDLEQHFSKYGKIVDVYISKKMTSGGNKGFGFVSFETQEAMERALQDKLHVICEKEIVVDVASPRDSTSDRIFVLPSNHYLFRSPRKKFFFKNKSIHNFNNSYYGSTKSVNSNSVNKDQPNNFPLINNNRYNDTSCNSINTNSFGLKQETINKNGNDLNIPMKNRTSSTYSPQYYRDKISNSSCKEKVEPLGYQYQSSMKYNYSTSPPNAYDRTNNQDYMRRYDPNYYLYYNNPYPTYVNNNVYSNNANITGEENFNVKNNTYSYYPSNYSNYESNYRGKATSFTKDNISHENLTNHSTNTFANTTGSFQMRSTVSKLPGGDEWNRRGYKLFVTKLNSMTTCDTIRNYFERFGEVIDVYLPNDPCTKRPRGIAFVTFLDNECVNSILSNTTLKHMIDGKEVVIDLADPESKRKKHLNSF